MDQSYSSRSSSPSSGSQLWASSSTFDSSASTTKGNSRHEFTKQRSNHKSSKSSIVLVTSSVLCLVTILNFVQDASNWKARSLAATSYMTEIQTNFVHDYVDLQLLEEERQELFMATMDEENENDSASSTSENENENENSEESQQHQPTRQARASIPTPLADFVLPKTPITCPEDMYQAPIVLEPLQAAENATTTKSKIPRILHMTGYSSCVTKPFYDGMLQWQQQLGRDYAFVFHNEDAVDALMFDKEWPEFPQLQHSMHCLKNAGGAAKADLWRYLALWEYGGIYTDMDNLPGELMNGTTIGPDVDAFFLQEGGGWLSQYFFAIAPNHPLMFLAVHDVMKEMHNLEDTGNFYVPQKTGPGATKRAFLYFMGMDSTSNQTDIDFYSKPPAGTYHSLDNKLHGNRTVTVVGSRRTNNQWVQRSAIGGDAKRDGWKRMNITSYQGLNKKPSGKSCLVQLHNHYWEQERDIQETLYRRRW